MTKLKKPIETENEKLVIEYGLSWLRGNRLPYFSVTGSLYAPDRPGGLRKLQSCGCLHDDILRLAPDMADIVALHLCDIDGAPMHALENGFFWLGGTHWQKPDFSIAASHFRISETEARALADSLFGASFSPTAGFLSQHEAKTAKARLAAWVEAQRPRWKAEADAIIAKYALPVPTTAES